MKKRGCFFCPKIMIKSKQNFFLISSQKRDEKSGQNSDKIGTKNWRKKAANFGDIFALFFQKVVVIPLFFIDLQPNTKDSFFIKCPKTNEEKMLKIRQIFNNTTQNKKNRTNFMWLIINIL